MLAKKFRVTTQKEFSEIYAKGIKARGKYGMLIFLPQKSPNLTELKAESSSLTSPTSVQQPNVRFGLVINNKLGKAVKRQKFKRWIRSFFQERLANGDFKNTNGLFSYVAYLFPTDYQSVKTDFDGLISQFNLHNSK